MSTPDGLPPAGPGGIPASTPGEVSLHAPVRSAPAAPPSSPASPGVSGGVTRVPTAPTLPDTDPASLHLAIARMANELFGAPAAPTASVAPAVAPAVAPSVTPSVAAPSTSSFPSSGSPPVAIVDGGAGTGAGLPMALGANPFAAAPNLGPLLAPASTTGGVPDSFTVPLVDASLVDAPLSDVPVSDVPVSGLDGELPPFSTPAAASTPAPTSRSAATRVPSFHPAFEVQPLVDTGVRPTSSGFDAHALKAEFPILRERVHGRQLVWLDNAATTQKPRAVIERIKTFYERENSNIHRAAHTLAARATDAYESARESVRRFLNASSVRDIVFVRGTTEGINLVAQSWGRRNIQAGDEIVLTHLEHHANIVPWQLLARETGARLRVAPVDDRGQILLDEYERLLTDKTKLVSLTQVSNALGTVTPAQQMIEMAQRRGARVLLDGAQSVSHMRVDLQALKPDFFVFSGHKVFGPTGIGAMVAPAALLDETPPWQGGGNMIQDVTFERTVFQPAPARFEAGTGNIADAVGLGAALDWVTRVGIENIDRHEHALLEYGTEKLRTIPGLRMIGTAAHKAGVLSFVIAGHDTHAVSSALDKEGIAVRGGHHCAQPILRRFGLESTVRASLAPYNTFEDLDLLVEALCRIVAAR